MELELDGDGFLVDRSVWNTEVMAVLAENSGIELTPDVEELIHKVREMFESSGGVVPPLREFSKATGGDRKGTHLNKIFNGAPMKKLARLAALPKPTGCI